MCTAPLESAAGSAIPHRVSKTNHRHRRHIGAISCTTFAAGAVSSKTAREIWTGFISFAVRLSGSKGGFGTGSGWQAPRINVMAWAA